MNPAPPSDSKALQVEIVISELLRWGVYGSLLLLVTGTVVSFLHPETYGSGGGSADDLHRLVTAGATFPRTLSWLGHGLRQCQGQAIIVAGLLLLIATPVIRVLVSIIAFALERDRAFVVITTVVFLVLLVSFALGKAG